MNLEQISMLAGMTSTFIFASSKFPMLLKVLKTRDLNSYSLVHISMSNFGNLLYWLYIISLPVGPVWLLQAFFTVADLLMLSLYLRYQFFQARTYNTL